MSGERAPRPMPAGDDDALHRLELGPGNRADLDLLAEKVGDEKPWYRTMGGAISVAAFVLSIVSGVYSCQRDIDQERQEARASLNTLSQRLLTLRAVQFSSHERFVLVMRVCVGLLV